MDDLTHPPTVGATPSDDAAASPRPAAPPPTRPALGDAIRKLARTSVLVVGDAMLDCYIYGMVERVSREAPVPVLNIDREVAVPGGAGNVVRNLGALGAAVAFISVVGDDQAGSDLTGLIGSQPGVEPWLLVQGSHTTTRKTRYMAQGHQLLRTDHEDTSPIHPKLAERMLRIVRDAMAATSVTILSDYGKGVLAGDLPAQIIAIARAAGRRVVVDPHGGDFARYAGADVLLPNLHELSRLAGRRLINDAELGAIAATLREQHHFGAVLINRAEDGVTVADASGVAHLRVAVGELIDVAGIGDTMAAALSAALAANLDISLASHIAALASGVVLGRPGISVAREADLLSAIAPQDSPLRKIVTLEAAAQRVEHWRSEGRQTAVNVGRHASVTGDAASNLLKSRACADRLVVGVERDADEQNHPPEAVRAAQLASLDCVDLVVMFDSSNLPELLHALRPHVLIGTSSQLGADLLPTWGGRVLAV